MSTERTSTGSTDADSTDTGPTSIGTSHADRITWNDVRESCRGIVTPRRWAAALRHPRRTLGELTGGGPVFPLLVLFGLNTVDELDRTGFGILLPEVRDAFGLSNTGILTLVGLTALGALVMQLPIAVAADRGNRVALALGGAALWAGFSVATGAATALWMLIVARTGSGIGRAVVDPTHNSLLSDFYAVDRRPAVFSFHRAANVLGQFLGPLLAGALAAAFTWRAPFFVFAAPTVVLIVLGARIRDPIRGAQERRAAGASADLVSVEEPRPSFAESWRLLWKVEVLRRIWYAVPFLAVSIVGFVSLAGLLYEEVYGLDELERGYLAAVAEPFQFLGLAVGAKLGTRLLLRDPALVFRFLRLVACTCSALVACFALAPSLPLTVLANIALTSVLAILLPGLFATLSLAIPARARAVGFSIAAWWAIPGLALLPAIGWVSDQLGIRAGMLVMVPVLLLGGLVVASGGAVVRRDIADVWNSSIARSRAWVDRRAGRSKLLVVKDLEVSYGSTQILHGVDLELSEGQVVALLGTNGAGKSTLLRAISGLTEASFGAVVLDGRDLTHAPPNEIAAAGVAQVPGGEGVFPSLSVAENLRAAGWTVRGSDAELQRRTEQVLAAFPALAERLGDPAANLSGGQQQMLALGMALLSRPRLLLIDELSLGLAPIVVGELAELVREVAAAGTAVLLVEQSLNVALTLAEDAHVLERGRIRYSGPTRQLAERPDLLRAVFLADAAAPGSQAPDAVAGAPSGDGVSERAAEAAVALRLAGVTRRFGGIEAVAEISLEVAEGEVVGLLGQNGAGKTTVFDLVCGYQRPDRGSVELGGVDVTGWSPHRRARAGLGRTFQGGRLFPGLTVTESLAVSLERSVEVRDPLSAVLRTPASQLSEARVRRRVEELIEIFGLGAHRDRFTAELSTGTRRIVEFACAVGHQPTVLLLDEPAAGVAQREVEQLAEVLERIRRELGSALVVIEHDVPLLAAISDRMVALEAGRVIATGTVEQVLSNPLVVASYLGDDAASIHRSNQAVEKGGTR